MSPLIELYISMLVVYGNLTENMPATAVVTLILMLGTIIFWEMLSDQSAEVGFNLETVGAISFTITLFTVFGSTIARALVFEKELPITLIVFAICLVVVALVRIMGPRALKKLHL